MVGAAKGKEGDKERKERLKDIKYSSYWDRQGHTMSLIGHTHRECQPNCSLPKTPEPSNCNSIASVSGVSLPQVSHPQFSKGYSSVSLAFLQTSQQKIKLPRCYRGEKQPHRASFLS